MNPLVNLLHLKFFCDAVVHRSVSEAAKVNFVTQSAVSQAIAKLERIFGIDLIAHNRQKFQITDDGQIVFEQARHIFKSVQEIFDKIEQNKETITGYVNFVCTNSLGMSFIAPSYQKMQSHFPQVQMGIKLGNLSYIRNALRQNEAEFAIVVYDETFSQYAKIPLRKGVFRLYQSKEAPVHLLEKGILVDLLDGMHVDHLLENFFRQNKYPLKIQAALAGWEVVARFAEKGIGVGFFPDYIMATDRYPTLVVCPVDIPPMEYEICAIHNKGEKLSRAAYAFIDQIGSE